MNDFLEFAGLTTSPAYVQDPQTGKYVRMFTFQLQVFRPVGHPDGETAFLPLVHVSEHMCQPLLETLKRELETHFRVASEQGSSGEGSEGGPHRLQ